MSSNFTYSFVVILPFCANGRRWSQGGIVKRLTILIFVVRADSFKSYPDLHRLSIVTRLLTLRRHGIVRADGDFGVIHKLFPHRMTLYFAFLCDWSIASAVHKTCFFFCLAPLTSATRTVHWYVRTYVLFLSAFGVPGIHFCTLPYRTTAFRSYFTLPYRTTAFRSLIFVLRALRNTPLCKTVLSFNVLLSLGYGEKNIK
jgi:hypothetical protein